MAGDPSGNSGTTLADAANALYPNQGGSQSDNSASQDQDNASSSKARIVSPYVVTNMTDGITTYHDPNSGKTFVMKTRNKLTSHGNKANADGPYNGKITGAKIGNLGVSFGKAIIYTDDKRDRWIHGGGNNKHLVPDPYAPRQGWVPTHGCTRGQNEDVEKMANMVIQFKKAHPKVPILYFRAREEASDNHNTQESQDTPGE